MILFTAKAIKILLALMCVLGGAAWLHKKQNKLRNGKGPLKRPAARLYILWAVLVAAFALEAQLVSGFLPPLRDKITVTALGEKNETAEATEVFLESFTVDGETVPVRPPVEGKWFWNGEKLCWRIETDHRQPEGMTRSVTLEVPVGWSRLANFDGNVWRGLVEVRTEAGTQTVDTYAKSYKIVPAVLGQSTSSRLIWNQIRHLAVYAALLTALSAAALAAVCWSLEDPQRARAWLGRHGGKLVCGGLALVTLILMICYADNVSFWTDEVSQLQISSEGIRAAIRRSVTGVEPTPPVSGVFMALWYKLAPYGQSWLLLCSMLCASASIYILGLTGEQMGNKATGILAAVLCASTSAVWTMQAYEFRSYPYLMLFTTMTLYCYVKRNATEQKTVWRVLYSLFLLLMGMTHYYGMFMCAAFFLADLYLWVKKQITWKTGFDYLVPGAVCGGWVIFRLVNGLISYIDNFNGSWSTKPTPQNIIALLHTLSGDREIFFYILLFSLCLGLIAPFVRKNKRFSWPVFYRSVFSWTAVLMIALIVLYGTVIKPDSPMFNTRYFLILIPGLMLLMASVMEELISACCGNSERGAVYKAAVYVCLGLSLYASCVFSVSKLKSSEPYREAADWIYTQVNYIFNEETLVASRDPKLTVDGWQEYYISRKGQRDGLNVKCQSEITEEVLLQYDRVYMQHCRAEVGKDLQALLDKYYDLETDNTSVKVRVYTRKQN